MQNLIYLTAILVVFGCKNHKTVYKESNKSNSNVSNTLEFDLTYDSLNEYYSIQTQNDKYDNSPLISMTKPRCFQYFFHLGFLC